MGTDSMRIAWVFPGQGAQAVGMGRALHGASAAARAVFGAADEALGEPLSALCFEGPAETLLLTANAQPALVATSMAALAALQESCPGLPQPAFAAGHSLGEYSALVAAEALRLVDAVRLVRLRGAEMQRAVHEGVGAMSAIMGLAPDAVRALCLDAADGEVVAAANFNAPGQVVIAGRAAAVARAGALAKARGGKTIPLKVSAPFHCALMRPVCDPMRRALTDVPFADPRFPVITNVDAVPQSFAPELRERLVRQVDGCIEWQATVERMRAEGVTHVLEIGPGKVLAGLVRRIDRTLEVLSVGEPGDIAKVPGFLGL